MPDDDARRAGERGTRHVEHPRHHQVRFVPGRGQRHGQVRIARKQGLPRRRSLRRHRPVVAADAIPCPALVLEAQRLDKQVCRRVWRTGWRQPQGIEAWRELPVGLDRLLHRAVQRHQHLRRLAAHSGGDFGAPPHGVVHGQHRAHLLEQVEGVLGLPSVRRHTEEPVFQWAVGQPQPIYPGVHPFSVRLHGATARVISRQCRPLPLGRARQAQLAALPVGLEGHPAHPFGQAAGGGAGLEVHLEEAVAGHEITLRPPGVGLSGGKDMGNATLVNAHLDGTFERGDDDIQVGRGHRVP